VLAGKIVKHTEGEVSESLIEPLGLKAERVQAGMLAPSAQGFPLSSDDQLPAVASTSQILGDPQEVHREPLPETRFESRAWGRAPKDSTVP
jgi:hypothetical protein